MTTGSELEGEVRAMLRERAAAVRVPASDAGLDAINRKLGEAAAVPVRRAPRAPWLVAAAAAVVVAVVGGTLVSRDDVDRDRTVVAGEGDGTGVEPGAFAAYPLLDAVWPTDDPDELRSIDAAWIRDERPLEIAKRFLESRFQVAPADADLVVDGETVRVTAEHDTVVHLGRLDGEIWYVQRATSDRLEVDVAYDGERVLGQVVTTTGGEVNVEVEADSGAGAGSSWPSTAGEPLDVDVAFDSEGAPVTVRTKLFGDAGVVGFEEWRALAPPDATEERTLGVWPKPADGVADEDLVDPVDTAVRYLMDAAGIDGGVELSDFRQGDSNSGEIEVTGAVAATIALRQVDGRWHVEAVHTPIIEARGDVPGELWLRATVEGILDVTVLDPWGTTVQSMPDRRMGRGEEVVVVPAEPVHKPFTVRYRFEPVDGTAAGIGDVAVPGTTEEVTVGDPGVHEVPDEAIFAGGGLDPIGAAQGYIEARLGFVPDDVRLTDDGSDGRATVDWERGSVLLVEHGGDWYVTESIGASVSFVDITLPDVEVLVGEAGTLVVQLLDAEGGVCGEVQTDVGGRRSERLRFDDVPCDVESVVATMNEVVAERAP